MTLLLILYLVIGVLLIARAILEDDALWAELSTYPVAVSWPAFVLGFILVALLWPLLAASATYLYITQPGDRE